MKERLILQPQAKQDVEEAFAYYLEQAGIALATRFVDAVDATLLSLLEAPGKGAPRDWLNPRLRGYLSWPVSGFEDFRIYYVERGESVTVARVLHGARDLESMIWDDADE